MGIHINDLKSNVEGYARGYLFNVFFEDTPIGALNGGESQTAYLVRSSSTPTGTIEEITIPWQGQTQKIGSTHTFDTWSCTFNVDRNANIRKNMEAWQKQVHDPETNQQGIPNDYYGTVKLELLDVDGEPIMTYTLHHAWPSEVGGSEVSHENKEIMQMECTFQYNYHTSE